MTIFAKHFRHIGPVMVITLILCSADCRAAEEVAPEEMEEVVEIRQGGYVEKLAPGVDFKDRLPRILPREPADSMDAFHIVPGVRIEQVAAEPLALDVVDMVFDENGRLFVAELIVYSELEQEGKVTNLGRVSMLEDIDGDGHFDTSTIYIDGLTWPTGLVPFDGGLFVATSPTLIYCKDTDDDGKADFQETILSGFDTSNPNACPNSLRFGLDNRIHGMTSTSGGKLLADKWAVDEQSSQVEAIESRGRDFSFHARSGQMRLESGGSQFGMTYDAWGRKFESSNSTPIEQVMYGEHYIARNPYLVAPAVRSAIYADGSSVYRTSPAEPWRILRTELRIDGTFSGPVEGGGTPAGYFTGACGVHVFNGTALPEEFWGNAFVCEGSGNLVHRMRLDNHGLAFPAHRVEQNKEFLTSDEIWFRPIQFVDGPDGALYMADMYREIYEHPDAVPPSARKYLDLLAGNDRGRVYRFVSEDFQQPEPVRLGSKSTTELVALLAHPNGWHRNTAARLLYERQDRKTIGPLVKLAAESDSELGRMHSMYVLDGLGMLSEDVVLGRLDDPNPRVREHAVRLAEIVLADAPSVRAKLYAMTDDADVGVRYQLAFTLGDISGDQATAALAAIATRDVADRWVRLAIASSSYARAGDLVTVLAANREWRATTNGRAFLEEMSEQAGLQDRNDQVAQVFTCLETIPEDEKSLLEAIVRGLGGGLEKSGNPLKEQLASGGKAGQAMAEMVDRAKLQAIDAELPIEQRVGAVRSLALAPLDEAIDVLGDLLDGRQTQEIQVAAIQALSRFQDPAVAELIVEEWNGFTPRVRAEAAETLFARSERLATLLDAVADGLILPSQLDPARVRFLLNHTDEKIREQADEILGSVELARREEVVEAYQAVLKMQGDAAKGKDVFKNECSTCHNLEGVGYDLGLPLNTVQNKGPEAILLAVLDPNRDVLPQYLNYVVITDDGLSLTGMIHSETATSITLRRAEGESDSVLRTRIDEMVNTGLSIMPEGLEEQLDEEAMADLIAYLMSLE